MNTVLRTPPNPYRLLSRTIGQTVTGPLSKSSEQAIDNDVTRI